MCVCVCFSKCHIIAWFCFTTLLAGKCLELLFTKNLILIHWVLMMAEGGLEGVWKKFQNESMKEKSF